MDGGFHCCSATGENPLRLWIFLLCLPLHFLVMETSSPLPPLPSLHFLSQHLQHLPKPRNEATSLIFHVKA